MHPNTYLRTFWRTEIRPVVFVAMSFDPVYNARFENVIQPAVEAITHNGAKLQAKRVDLSKSGDSILTDINDGIAHSAMVLADVSTIGHDSKTGLPYRNGNVMYEVGLALASRHSSEVLLVRDDKAPFLFDVSVVPHMHVDFSDPAAAAQALTNELKARLNEIAHILDARIAVAVATLTAQERQLLGHLARYQPNEFFAFDNDADAILAAMSRLLDKQLVRPARSTSDGRTYFKWTRLGRALAVNLDALIPRLPPNAVETEQPFSVGETTPTAE